MPWEEIMRNVILFNLITLDGYFEGRNKWDIAWHQVDDEFNEFSIEQLNKAGGLIFGRVTYQGMASYWPTPTAIKNESRVAGLMNSITKYVFSNTLDKSDWNNTKIIKGDAAVELKKLKQESGKDLFIFDSADLASAFTKNRLIDEYRLIVNPIALGEGNPLFKQNGEMLKLKLLNTKSFRNGNVLLYYQPDGR
jgi:dihydrofolate reductase